MRRTKGFTLIELLACQPEPRDVSRDPSHGGRGPS